MQSGIKLGVRIKHWFDMNPHMIPTPTEVFALGMFIVNLWCLYYMWGVNQTVAFAQDVIVQNERILGCMNNKGSLGAVQERGETWDVTCQIVLKKRMKT